MITGNIIGFGVSEKSADKLYAVNPLTLENLQETFVPATEEEVNQAMEKAFHAWRIYRNISGDDRCSFLLEIAKGMEGLGDTLISRVMLETGYPEARVKVEFARTCNQLRMFADEAVKEEWKEVSFDEALPDRTPIPRPSLRKTMFPLGPVVVFGASNFPLAYSTAGGDTASALAAGCPVVVKAHDSHLGTNALVAEVIMEAARKTRMPDGVFSALNGDGLATGKQLVLHPRTAAVGFTGSHGGGRALFDLGQQRATPIPVFAEMGSVNPIFLLPEKMKEDPEALAGQLAASMTLSGGQFCTQPGILVALDDDTTEQLKIALCDKLDKADDPVLLNQGISQSYRQGIAQLENSDEVNLAFHRKTAKDQAVSPALAVVRAEQFIKNPMLHREIFGPFSLLVLCTSHKEMSSVAEMIEGQLTASVFMREKERVTALPLIDMLIERVGRIIINGVPTGVEVCDSMTHGGPYPATTDSRFTAVGKHAVMRWLRPVTFQNFPKSLWINM